MKKLLFIVCVAIVSSCSSKKIADNDGEIPGCIQKLIRQFEEEDKQNPPRSIYRYTYKNNFVYYVAPVCCDQFSDLYSSSCELLGHPDGGITGKGDMKLPDFGKERTGEKLVWKDERK